MFERRQTIRDSYWGKGYHSDKQRPFGRKNEVDAPESGIRHSGSYHKYFRGYTEVLTDRGNGKQKITRVYTAPWVVQNVSDQLYWGYRIFYGILVLLSMLLYIWVMCLPDLNGNHQVFVAIFGMPAMILLVLCAAVTAFYIFTPRKMTAWDHESSSGRLKKMALATSILLWLTAAAIVVNIFLGVDSVLRELGCAVSVAVSGAAAFAIFYMERHMDYKEIPNDTPLPEGEAYEIW